MAHDPFANILLQLTIVIGLAVIGRYFAVAISQPPVFGELVMGAAAAALTQMAGGTLAPVVLNLSSFGSLGVILLLFYIGLETEIEEMAAVGKPALLVAIVGVVAPLIVGFFFAWWMTPFQEWGSHVFVAAALCATSVGVTARVFKDLKRLQSPEAKLVLSAAVIDDVLGLIVLALVSGLAAGGELNLTGIITSLAAAGIFIAGLYYFGRQINAYLVKELSFLFGDHSALLLPLIICFLLSWIAAGVHLAAIIGAFGAGLIARGKPEIKKQAAPLEIFFVPIFFVLAGMQVDFGAVSNPMTFGLVVGLSLIAIATKLCCAFVAGPGVDKWTVGIGMIPRGEVGLIFAATGKALGVLDDAVFSALVIMVLVTTVVTPPALRHRAENSI
jgi:Kef-type K+ transport system membrane component KefB